MDALIIRAFQGGLSPSEKLRLHEWREADEDNERRFQEVREVWLLSGLGASVVEAPPDPETLIARAEARVGPGGSAGERAFDQGDERAHPPFGRSKRSPDLDREGRSPWGPRFRAGSLAAGLIAVGFGLAQIAQLVVAGPADGRVTEVQTAEGERTTVTLPDGSSVRLGPRTRLRLLEDDRERRLHLDGRGFFGVEPDLDRPFVVETPYGDAVALGTRFEVRAEEGDDLQVLVVEGRVSVSAVGVEVEVAEGELTRVSGDETSSTVRVDDVYARLDWMGNHLVFRATPLSRVAHELERWYGVTVTLEDPRLGAFPVTATFTGAPVEDVVLVLCEIARVDCDVGDGRIRIGARASAASLPSRSGG